MPVSLTVPQTVSGREYVHALISGEVSLAEAHQLMDGLRSGQRYHLHPLMAVVAAGTSFSVEARKVFGEQDPDRNAKNIPTAVVVHSAALRVMMLFIFRVAGAKQRARVFANETEALAWFQEALG